MRIVGNALGLAAVRGGICRTLYFESKPPAFPGPK